jgi:hypothetical protein
MVQDVPQRQEMGRLSDSGHVREKKSDIKRSFYRVLCIINNGLGIQSRRNY